MIFKSIKCLLIFLAISFVLVPNTVTAHWIQTHEQMTRLARHVLATEGAELSYLNGSLVALLDQEIDPEGAPGKTYFEALIDGVKNADLRGNGLYAVGIHCLDYTKSVDQCLPDLIIHNNFSDWPVGDHGYDLSNEGTGFFANALSNDLEIAPGQTWEAFSAQVALDLATPEISTAITELFGLSIFSVGTIVEERLNILENILKTSNAVSMAVHFHDKAIEKWNQGHRVEALEALGVTLHLVQDMTVPTHVRIKNQNELGFNDLEYESYVWKTELDHGKTVPPVTGDYRDLTTQEWMEWTANRTNSFVMNNVSDSATDSVQLGVSSTVGMLRSFIQAVNSSTIFSDNFEDASIDSEKWPEVLRNDVTETDDILKVETNVTDSGGILRSKSFSINNSDKITIKRKVKLHYNNDYFIGKFRIYIDDYKYFGIDYGHMIYDSGDYSSSLGFYIVNNCSTHNDSSVGNYSARIDPVWDQWFDEKIIYDPVSGLFEYFINNQKMGEYNVGSLSLLENAQMHFHFDAWGWWTGHYHYFDDFVVTQGAISAHEIDDADGDGFQDFLDNCPLISNSTQTDVDNDGTGDSCDLSDTDNDGLIDSDEVIFGTDPIDSDSDNDGVPDGMDFLPLITFSSDNCPNDPNKTEPGINGCGIADSERVQITSSADISEVEPAWALDGTRILYQTKNIFTNNLTGDDPVQVTFLPDSRRAWGGVYQPNTDRIYYLDNSPSGADYWWICWTNTDGSAGRNQVWAVPGGQTISSISFSPDGSQFTFICRQEMALYIMNANGTLDHKISGISAAGNVSWGKGESSNKILYNVKIGDVYTLNVIDVDGSNNTQLTDESMGSCNYPSWDPDGKSVVFARVTDNQIYQMNLDGSDLTKLTDDQYINGYPEISPDGGTLLYASKEDGGSYDIYLLGLASPSPLTNTTAFVQQVYQDFLNRDPDSDGLAYWVNAIDVDGVPRAQLVENFLASDEFGLTVASVTRLYFAYFNRIPDYSGLMYWISAYSNGISLTEVSSAFAGSEEFTDTYGSLNNSDFVTLVYQNLFDRNPDAGGLNYWTGVLDSNEQTRGQVMIGFSESDEYLALMESQIYVTMTYIGLLRRSPDQGGFDWWVNNMDTGGSGLALIEGFLTSDEYAARF